jgi:hypothetical protein
MEKKTRKKAIKRDWFGMEKKAGRIGKETRKKGRKRS